MKIFLFISELQNLRFQNVAFVQLSSPECDDHHPHPTNLICRKFLNLKENFVDAESFIVFLSSKFLTVG